VTTCQLIKSLFVFVQTLRYLNEFLFFIRDGIGLKFNCVDGVINRTSYIGKYAVLNGRPRFVLYSKLRVWYYLIPMGWSGLEYVRVE